MSSLNTTHPIALRLLMTDDLYAVEEVAEISKPDHAQAVLVPEKKRAEFQYMGENNAYFLAVLHYPDQKYAEPAVLDSLEKILKGKKMELRDIALLNIAPYPDATFADFKDFFACSKLVLFGINPKQIGLGSLNGNEVNVCDGVNVLPTYSFEEMAADDQKKRLFWNVMKTI